MFLTAFERKTVRKIYFPVKEEDESGRKKNKSGDTG
jgi:hypothetical protein